MRFNKVNKAIISTFAVCGVLALIAVAPNLFSVLPLNKNRSQQKKRIHDAVQKMIDNGYLFWVKGKIGLTPKGKQVALAIDRGRVKIKKPKIWDKKWRILIFDIPEIRKGTRDRLRMTLENAGFAMLQYSVWVHPYECEDLVSLITQNYKLEKQVVYIEAQRVEGDSFLKRRFGLS